MYFPSLETIGTFIVAATVMYVILYLGQVRSHCVFNFQNTCDSHVGIM